MLRADGVHHRHQESATDPDQCDDPAIQAASQNLSTQGRSSTSHVHALRGLAQSMARELAPQGIHVAHFVIDGGIRNPGRTEPPDRPDSMLDPDAIAASYWHVVQQPRSAWTWEVELRPWVERF